MRRLAAALLLLAFLAPVVVGDEDPLLSLRLGSPAQRAEVRAALASLDEGDAQAAVWLAGALGQAGGVAAVEGLVELGASKDDGVRAAVLRSAACVGLRSEALLGVVRQSVGSMDRTTRRTALLALGRIGDGRDVPLLLDLAETDPLPRVRWAAEAALAKLARRTLPKDSSRRRVWWAEVSRRAEEQVPAALEAIAGGADPKLLRIHRAMLGLLAWADLESIRETAREWFQDEDQRLRAEACQLVATLGLADLCEDVQSARLFDTTGDLELETRQALEALGLPAR